MKKGRITYSQVGDNYDTKDPVKKLAQLAAAETAVNLKKNGYKEVSDSRGESAFVWEQGGVLMASVIEGLGTKNLVADGTREVTGKTYYDVIAHDTVATIINDLVTVGAKPLVLHAYWAIEDNSWLQDRKRLTDFVNGWKNACDLAGVTWGGGETPTLKGIIQPNTVELGGSAVGVISPKSRLVTDNGLKEGDRILLLKSTGINANGLSLARAIAKKIPGGYATKLAHGKTFGEVVLNKTNIYADLVQKLFAANINIHYISNITGHGLRKIMRARKIFTYVLERVFKPQEVFNFIQKEAGLTDLEMYETYNMGQDYALFIEKADVRAALEVITKCGFEGIDAGDVQRGKKRTIIKTKNLILGGRSLDLR